MIGIKGIATFFAGKKVTTANLIAGAKLEKDEHGYFNSIGIDTLYNADTYEGFDLAKEAAVKVLQNTNIDAASISLVIYIQNRLLQYLMSSNAARLQYEIGAVNANAFSVSDMGCTDMTMAIKIAKDFLIANTEAQTVLIAYGNKPYAPSRFRFPVTINGDGGIALLICRTNDNQILDINIKTQGNYWDLFQVVYQDKKFSDYKELCASQRKYGFELAIESKLRLLKLNEEVLDRNGLEKNDIHHYLIQNLSTRSYQFYESSFGIKLSAVCQLNLKKYGHLGPGDVMLNYLTGIETGLFQKGDKVLVMNSSPVAAWSNILLQV